MVLHSHADNLNESGTPVARPNIIQSLVKQGSFAYNISERSVILMWMAPVLVLLLGVGSALMGKEVYKLFTGEDKIAETLQVIFYALALVFNLSVLHRLWQKEQRFISCLYLIVLVGLFFLIGEELNWGQRFFGWETSETFTAINKQHETNIHNIHGVGHAFKWIQLMVGAYGTLIPLLVFQGTLLRAHRQVLSLLVPHITLIPFFVPLFMWRIYRNFFEAPPNYYFVVSEFNEVMELILSMGMALFMILQYKRLRRSSGRSDPLF